MITSRQRLGLSAERVLAVGPLEPEEARALLADRAAAPLPDRAEVDALLDRLDRLPLAIELAAPLLDTLGVSELTRRLDARFELLETDAPDQPAGHRSLRGVLASSWEGLAAPERRALAALSLFSGTFDAGEAEALLGPGALGSLRRLSDAALLHREREGALRLLESTGAFAAEQLALHPDREALGLAYAEAVLDRAEASVATLHGPTSRASGRALERALDDLRRVARLHEARRPDLAIRALLASGPALLLRGPLDPALPARLIALSEAPEAAPHRARAAALAGALLHAVGRLSEAAELLRAALDPRPEDPTIAAELAARLGFVLASLGEVTQGAALLEGAAAAPQASPRARAMALVRLGAVRHLEGAHRAASTALKAALALHQAAGDAAEEARTLGNLALWDLEQGRHEAAWRALERALEQERLGGSRLAALQLRLNLGSLAHLLGDLDDAWRRLESAAREAESLGDPLCLAIAWHGLGVLALERRDPVTARGLLGRARIGFEAAGQRGFTAAAWGFLAVVEAMSGDEAAAATALAAAEELPPGALLAVRAALALCAGEVDQGHALLAEARLHPGSAARLASRVAAACDNAATERRERAG